MEEKEETKKSEAQNKEAKFCPKCRSEEIEVDATLQSPHDYCQKCGFNSRQNGIISIIPFPIKQKIPITKAKPKKAEIQ